MATQMLLFVILAVSSAAWAAPLPVELPFKVKAPSYWVLDAASANKTGSVYQNERSKSFERVALTVVQSSKASSNLALDSSKLEQVRSLHFRRLGLSGYTILSLSKRSLPSSTFRSMQLIQARYRDFAGREVQVLERQFSREKTLYVIAYMIDGPALNSTERANQILDLFEPIARKNRIPASEISRPQPAASSPQENLDAAQPTKIVELDMRDPKNNLACRDVPQEKRRTVTEPAFMDSAVESITDKWGCIQGLGDNLWGMVTSAAELGWNTLKFINPFSSEYRDQVYATTGVVVAEIRKDPKAFASRVASELWTAAAKQTGQFFQCLNTKEQLRIVCNIGSNLIPLGLLTKVVVKGPMTTAEASTLAKVIDEATGPTAGARIAASKSDLIKSSRVNSASERVAAAHQQSDAVDAPRTMSRYQAAEFTRLSAERTLELRGKYTLLSTIAPEDQTRILILIDRLEARGVSANTIRAELDKSPGLCGKP